MTGGLGAVREDVLGARPRAAAWRSCAQSAGSEFSSRGIWSALVGDVVEQDHLPDLARVGGDVGLRAAQRALLEVAAPDSRRVPPRRRRGRGGSRDAPPAAARRRIRASSTTAAVPAALSLAPTKPCGMRTRCRSGRRPRSPGAGPGMTPTMFRSRRRGRTSERLGSSRRQLAAESRRRGAAAASRRAAARTRPAARSASKARADVEAIRARTESSDPHRNAGDDRQRRARGARR